MRERFDPERLVDAVSHAAGRSRALFDDLAANTADEVGVTRTSYGEGEQYAHRLLERTARELGLETEVDPAGNLYMTLPGRDRRLPRWVVGSHLDSVPRGGNYDGAAGVIAGVAAIEALQRLDFECERGITVMGIRAEEAAWYIGKHGGHLGSRMALGLMKPEELETAVRWDSGRTLGEHMRECGCDVDAVRRGPPFLTPAKINGYLELHIEQGPVLEHEGFPVGVVTSIRGNSRLRDARCMGKYDHGGGTPQEHRKDAVIATAALVTKVDEEWQRLYEEKRDLVFAFGKLFTDPKVHSMSKVPGEVRFSLDLRSGDSEVLAAMRDFVRRTAEAISSRRKVEFELGDFSIMEPTVLDPALRAILREGCDKLSIPYMELPSGGGHDAQEFAKAGVPSAMIFLRNAHGSHVAEESMEMADFVLGTRLLAWMLALH